MSRQLVKRFFRRELEYGVGVFLFFIHELVACRPEVETTTIGPFVLGKILSRSLPFQNDRYIYYMHEFYSFASGI